MPDELHVSMASGGAYAVLYSSFWSALDSTPSGKMFRQQITQMSGSSAGAIVGCAVANGTPGQEIHSCLLHCGIRDRIYYLRLLMVYLRLKRSLYTTKKYERILRQLLASTLYQRVPLTVAVTDENLTQQCITYSDTATNGVVNAVLASAAIPFVFNARNVPPYGMCSDGSLAQHVYPAKTVTNVLQGSSGRLVVINCLPWPGYRRAAPHSKPAFYNMSRILSKVDAQLYAPGMEQTFDFIIQPRLKYEDGIFDIWIDNTLGSARQVPAGHGNLHVVFVAPTTDQFIACGGAMTKSSLYFRPGDKRTVAMEQTGRSMAFEFITRYGQIAL